MKKKILRRSVGMDIGKDFIYLCVKNQDIETNVSIKSTTTYSNTSRGWEAISKYLKKHLSDGLPYKIILEATGIYHENIAYYLHDLGYEICIILPKQSYYFAKSINMKSKNDNNDSKMLAQMGIEKFGTIKKWNAPSATMKQLRQLTRHRRQLVDHCTQYKNQKHSLEHSHQPNSIVLVSVNRQIEFLDEQISGLEKQIKLCVESEPELEQGIQNICTIKGFSLTSAAVIVAETYGFELFTSIPQLVSYAGYDVIENQSGKRTGKTKISKKGNSNIRAALFFPALVTVKHTGEFKSLNARIYERNPKVKMIGYVAVQRKLLVLAYTLYKNNDTYDPNYQKKKTQLSKDAQNKTEVMKQDTVGTIAI